MGGRLNARTAAVVIVVLALAGGAVALLAGSDNGSKPGAAGGGPGSAPKKPPAAKLGPIRPHGKRERVHKGRHGSPDEPARGTGALLGIADQKPETFADPRFRALGVARSRLNTPWNSIFTEPARLGAWLNAARAAGVEPLVAFEHGRGDACPAQPCVLPPLSAYEKALRQFHATYPWVRLIQPWNEANSSTQPTGKHPEQAAAYYEVARRVCPGCTITAADLLDATNVTRWLTRFRRALNGRVPRLWGLHNYSDVNRFRDVGTRHLLSLVPGEVWLTETGGIVSFVTAAGKTALPYDEARAARATRYLFRLAGLYRRITRVYIYQWKIDFPGNRFDAGLVAPDGRPRPALAEVSRKRALLR